MDFIRFVCMASFNRHMNLKTSFDQSDHKEFFSIHFKLDVAFDGADEVDESLNLIKGGG